jgi:thiosulfate dehydrogenase [quinone] large subunit
MLIPMRLFLGVTFVYAGIQKLADPQFFKPTSPGYIGRQIIGFAHGSPLRGFLMQFVIPHSHFFGVLIIAGEIAIGLGTLVGFLLRPAAFFGLLISLMFYLTASWHVYPYFYGADIVFVFCWLTLLIAGPARTGYPALDVIWVQRLLSPGLQARYTPALSLLLGVDESAKGVPIPNNDVPTTGNAVQTQNRRGPVNARPNQQLGNARPNQQQSRYAAARRSKESRRNFLLGTVTGGVGMLGLAWLWNTLHIFSPLSDNAPASTATATSVPPGGATSTTTPSAGGTAIAQVSQVKNNSSVSFTLASNGDPGILVRLNDGNFVCYDATCTHAGCPVDYDPSSQLLVCPCHGAQFDPSKSAAVVQGPTNTPLTNVPIHVDNASGAITVQ